MVGQRDGENSGGGDSCSVGRCRFGCEGRILSTTTLHDLPDGVIEVCSFVRYPGCNARSTCLIPYNLNPKPKHIWIYLSVFDFYLQDLCLRLSGCDFLTCLLIDRRFRDIARSNISLYKVSQIQRNPFMCNTFPLSSTSKFALLKVYLDAGGTSEATAASVTRRCSIFPAANTVIMLSDAAVG